MSVELSAEAVRVVRNCLRGKVPGLQGRCPPQRVIEELGAAGLNMQVERPLHEPRMCYPLNILQFKKRAAELGLTE